MTSPLSSSSRWYIGIDVSSETLALAAVNEHGDIQPLPTFSNDKTGIAKLLKFLRQSSGEAIQWVGCESTGYYHLNAIMTLSEQGFSAAVLNPYQVKAYGRSQLQRNKTDKADAALIARFTVHQAQAGLLSRYQMKTEARQRLYEYVRLLDSHQQLLVEMENRAESLQDKMAKHLTQKHIKRIKKEVKQLEGLIDRLCRSEAEFARKYALLQTIPGIGMKSAAAILAEEVDLATDKRALCAKHALAPGQSQSGKSVSRTRLSPHGGRWLRRVLYLPAMSAMRWNVLVQEFAARRRANGMRGRALVCACEHKLMLIIFGVLKNQKPFNPNILSERT